MWTKFFYYFLKFSAPKNPFFSFPKHQKEGIVKEKTAWLVILLKKKKSTLPKKKINFFPIELGSQSPPKLCWMCFNFFRTCPKNCFKCFSNPPSPHTQIFLANFKNFCCTNFWQHAYTWSSYVFWYYLIKPTIHVRWP